MITNYFTYILLLSGFLLSCGKTDAQEVRHISPKEAHELIKKDTVTLLDVRSEEEYRNDGHLPDAYLIPVDELASRLSEVPKSKKTVVYCRSGNRSVRAAELLQQHGIDASTMDGGILQWEQEGFEVKR